MELKGVPNYPTLFGSLDGCECLPCESVYSPAAYLTDLLAFIESKVEPIEEGFMAPDNGLEAIKVRSFCDRDNTLVSDRTRRPDILATKLSCRNAETLLPYVDLVLEIMENAVSPHSGGDARQTTLPADRLAAQPEHFNEDAYEQLTQAMFPFNLPFDLWHEEETIYLEKLGTSRVELLETFYQYKPGDETVFPNGEPHDLTEIRRWQDTEIAKARLGLADAEWSIFVDSASTNAVVSKAWGYPQKSRNSPRRSAGSCS